MNDLSSNSSEGCTEPDTDESDSELSIERTSRVKKKKKSYKGRTGSTVSQSMLPPCRICGENASGFHYGANTCEACKAFFRRSMQRGALYACPASEKCEVLSAKRSSCAACRLKKCISVGMSKSAIKTGRYTYAKKARDIMEVKALTKCAAACVDAEPPAPNVSDHSEVQMVARSFPTHGKLQSSEPNVDELDEVIQRITTTQAKLTFWTPEVLAKQADREKLYLESKTMRQQIFGPLKTLSEEEYMRLYETTGIDVDGRLDRLKRHCQQFADREIKCYIEFVKAIPGFCQLPIEDQMALVKGSRVEYWIITAQRAFNPDEMLYTHYDGNVMSIDEMDALNNSHDLNEMAFKFQEKLQKLGLNEEENCILAAMCVMSADVCNLENADQVACCQSLLRRCFQRLMEKYHSDDPLFVARVVAVLVELRSVSEMIKFCQVQVGLRWADKVEIPPLLIEIFSSL